MLKLPPANHPVLTLMRDIPIPATVDQVLSLPSMREARHRARRWLGAHPTVELYHTLVLRDDEHIVLKTWGRMGGNKTRWNFGRWIEPRQDTAA